MGRGTVYYFRIQLVTINQLVTPHTLPQPKEGAHERRRRGAEDEDDDDAMFGEFRLGASPAPAPQIDKARVCM